MKKFYDFLAHVLKMPGMYRVSNAEDLYFVILGYSQAAIYYDTNVGIEDFFADFNKYVSSKYDMPLSGWERIFTFFSGSNQGSLDLFKENFHKFYKQYSKKMES